MSLIIPANSASAAGGYAVDNSCRFNDGSSDNLSRTTETPTNAKKYTFSVWVKRSNIGAANAKIFGVQGASANDQNMMEFNADYLWWAQSTSSGQAYRLKSNRKFRDIAWYHIVVAYDSTQGTANNRIRMYINGVEETSFSSRTNPSANLDSLINSSVSANAGRTLRLGRTGDNGSQYFDGYMSEVCFIDGLQLDPTSFGEFDEDSGIFKPIDVSGLTFGNNGFYLDYEDSSALGADVSGNSNNFTVNNLTAIDKSTDTCTNNGNVHNALIKDTPTLSEGNLNVTTSTSGWETATGTIGVNTSKWYCEYKVINKGSSAMFGVIAMTEINAVASGKHIGYSGINSLGYGYNHNGSKYNNDVNASYGNSYTTGDIIGIALDLDNHKLYFSKNGTWQNSGNPESGATGTGSAYNLTTGYYYTFGCSVHSSSDQMSANFGSPPYAVSDPSSDANGYGAFDIDTVPSGYYALNTKNLSEYG